MPEPELQARERRFDELFGQHLPAITSYCRWRSRSAADAEDAVSEVFLTLWRRLDDVDAGDGARVWLYATARRVTANQLRASRRRLGLLDRLVAQPVPLPPVLSHDTDDSAADRVRAALAHLRALDREVLLLSEWEELSPAEIAVVLGCPPSSARGRLHRARRRFREVYERLAGDGDPEADPEAGPDPRLDVEGTTLQHVRPERSLCDA